MLAIVGGMMVDYKLEWHDGVLRDRMSFDMPWFSPRLVVRTSDGFVFGPPEVRTIFGVPPRDWRLLGTCHSVSWGDVLYAYQSLLSRRAVRSITAQCDMRDVLCYVSVGGRAVVRPYVHTIRPLTAPSVLMYYLTDEGEVARLDGYGRTWRYATISARGAQVTCAIEAHVIGNTVRSKLATILRVPEDTVSVLELPAWEGVDYVQVLD